jgi:hypothetical protein
MKAKINLQRNHGRIDIMQMTAPYPMQSTDNIATDRENKLATAYSANYSQACLLLQAIQMNGRRRLSQQCICMYSLKTLSDEFD